MKRAFHLRTAALAAALLSAAACTSTTAASTASSSAADAAPVTLTMWGTYGNGGNTAQTQALAKLITKFQSANPNITVNYVDMPYDQLKQKLTTSAAGGGLPDVLRSDIGWVAQFGKLGAFAPLDTEMPGFGDVAKSTYPGTLAANKYNGHYYGMPLDTNTRVLVTSPDVLAKAGMTAPPATFDDFKAMAAKLPAGTQLFADSGLQGWNVLPWIWSGGGDITDADVTKATGYLNSDKSVAAVQMLVDLYKAKQIPNLITGNQGGTSTSDGLPGGKYATILDGPWMVDIWGQQYPSFKPVFSQVPAGPGGSVSVVGGESMVMSETSTHKDAALKFIQFTLSDDFQLGMADAGQMPVVATAGTKAATAHPYYSVFATQLQTAKARLPIPDAGQVDTILNTELTKAFNGSESVKDALTAAASQIDPLLKA